MSRTVWIQANQLGRDNSALAELLRPSVPPLPAQVLMIEAEEPGAAYRCHRRKLVLLFSAMRHFAEELRKRRITVDYHPLRPDGSHPHRTMEDALTLHLRNFSPAEITLMELPSLGHRQASVELLAHHRTPYRVLPNTAMLTDRGRFSEEHRHGNRLLMEPHYRSLRRRCRLLVEGDRPVGGRWRIPPGSRRSPKPEDASRPLSFVPDAVTSEVIRTVEALFTGHPGSAEGFDLPVTHAEAIALADDFIAHRLSRFGLYRDAMLSGELFLQASFLSPFLNIGLLSPLHLLKKIEHAYHSGTAPLHAVEGFFRQALGMREFLYGAYHCWMPSYQECNFLDARRGLPEFFWSGATELRCLADTIRLVLRTGFLDHARRLMIIGNFATLAGIRPLDLHNWCMSLFLDSSEWVTLPNVLGSGTFADGGRIASLPSVFPGKSIARRSDFCGRCRYSASAQTGPEACPFNYLFWNFLDRNRTRLSETPRLARPYRALHTLTAAERRAIRRSAEQFLLRLSR